MNIIKLLNDHIFMYSLSMIISTVIAIALGIISYYNKYVYKISNSILSIFQVIPSLAQFGILIPITGLGIKPTIIVLTVFSLYPIYSSTYTALSNIDSMYLDAASQWCNNFQSLRLVLLPIASTSILSGIRTSSQATLGNVIIASYVGAGGLGQLILSGMRIMNIKLLLTGSILVSVLSVILINILIRLNTYKKTLLLFIFLFLISSIGVIKDI